MHSSPFNFSKEIKLNPSQVKSLVIGGECGGDGVCVRAWIRLCIYVDVFQNDVTNLLDSNLLGKRDICLGVACKLKMQFIKHGRIYPHPHW